MKLYRPRRWRPFLSLLKNGLVLPIHVVNGSESRKQLGPEPIRVAAQSICHKFWAFAPLTKDLQ